MTRTLKNLAVVASLVLVIGLPQISLAEGWTYEELVRVYISEKGQAAPEAQGEMGNSVELEALNTELELWEFLLATKEPVLRAEVGKRLLKMMVDGDPSRWNELSGFLSARGFPRSVVAFQTALITSASLLQIDEEGAAWEARGIAQDLFRSSKTRIVTMKADSASARRASSELRLKGGQSWVDRRGGPT